MSCHYSVSHSEDSIEESFTSRHYNTLFVVCFAAQSWLRREFVRFDRAAERRGVFLVALPLSHLVLFPKGRPFFFTLVGSAAVIILTHRNFVAIWRIIEILEE